MSKITEAFERLRANAPNIARTNAAERIAKLKALYKATYDRRADIDVAAKEELGLDKLSNMFSLMMLKSEIDYAVQNLENWMKPKAADDWPTLMGKKAYVHYEPKGVLLHISTWNAPVLISLQPIVAAIAAGNAVVVKPSEIAPKQAQIVKEIIDKAFAQNEVVCFTGGPDVAQELLALPFNHICYVGNNRVGRIIMRAAAENFAGVTLEMGGKNPAIVDKSADVKDAAMKVANGRAVNAGQVCLSPDYALVHRSVEREFIDQLKAAFTQMFNPDGKGFDKSPAYPRIVNQHHVARIKGLLEDAVKKGAKLEFGGEVKADERFIAPTILTGVTSKMEISDEEVFGPIIYVQSFDTAEEAVAEVAKRPKALGTYIFAKERSAIDYYMNNTRSGTSAINNTVIQAGHPTLPFGGANHSGIGRIGGHAGFVEFSNPRAVVEDPMDPNGMPPMYPPFPEVMEQMIEPMLTP